MKKFLLVIFVFLYFQCWSQGNMITITGSVPAQMTVCGPSKVFNVTIYNPSPFLLSNDTLKIAMPAGVTYQAGSVVGATYLYTSSPNTAIFLLANIPTLTTINLSFSALVNCDVMAFISGGGVIQNNIRVNYTANNVQNYDTKTTSSYIIRQPNLSITTVTNQSYTGNIGDVFTRCITIINGGFGELSQFTLTDIHGSGIQITAVNHGTWTTSGTTESIVLSGIDFSGVGNGNNLFENGESITICETVHVLSCISVASAFEAFWGCNAQHCQSSVSNGNVVFPNLIPNLIVTPIASMNSCLNNASVQQLKIVNTGLGKAVNIQLDIFQSTNSGYQASVGSNIDPASFTTQVGFSSAPSSITTTSNVATAALACMSSPIGKVSLTIPTINPGDTIYLKWNTYSCCYNSCTGVGQNYINGWRFKGTYQNICQSDYVIAETWGRVYAQLYGDLSPNGSPSTLTDGQTGTFNFLFSNYQNTYPVGPGASWKFEFTLPACLTYAGNLEITRSNGIDVWHPDTIKTSGNIITAIFLGAPPWDLLQAQITIDLTVNCAACGGSGGASSLAIKSFYFPNKSCACAIGVSCQNAAISVLCPAPCPEGMIFKYFEITRTSYGLPDNEAGGGNGIPDLSGSLDFTKIKTDRAMFGDTVTSSFNGIVRTSFAHPTWQYCYATSSITNGNRITFLDASLNIYRGGLLLATCTNFTPVISNSGTTRTFKYDLSVSAHLSCLPGGFVYSDNDSVVFNPRYKVTSNISSGTPLNCYSTNEYYMSDIANPTLAANKFQCGNYNGNFTVIGYYFTNCCGDSYAVKSCDNVVLSQNYYLSIGPCCNNYAGGNLFPYEYRNWAHIRILTAILPTGYDFVSARFNQVRTSGTLVLVTDPTPSSWQAITPVNPNSDTLKFPVEQYFKGYGGTIPLSDDGFYGTLQVTIKPSCKVTPTISQAIADNWTFATTRLVGTGSYPTYISTLEDSIIYQAPALFIQSTLPSVNAPDSAVSWNISISNTSNTSNSLNTWLSGPQISGVSIIQMYDLDNHIVINPVGSIYQIGTINATTVRNFRITANFTSCAKDSIIIYSGWNCNDGYPTSVQTYPCTAKTIKLALTPLLPALVVNVTAPSSTIQLCDTASYTLEGINVQLGTAYNVNLTAILPLGVTIVPGTSQLSYPVANPYRNIPNPTFLGGTTWQWSMSSIDTTIEGNGLKGILIPTLNSFKLTFKVITNCGYTSGSTIAFNLTGNAACGLPTGQNVALSSELGITGATTPYHTAIKLLTTYISPCANNSSMHVAISNHGPLAFGGIDSITIQLPVGVSFVSGSFSGIHNAPINTVPAQYILNNSVYLGWKLPSGVAVGDSAVFTFDYKGNPQTLSCDITEFDAHTTSSTNVTCTQSGSSCGINIATGDTTLSVFTYKAYLSLSNGHAISIPNPPSGEKVTVNLDITNSGEAILSGANSIIQFYQDTNGNGIYNTGDVFLTQDSLLITNNSIIHYSKTFAVGSGKACSIIAIIRTIVNPCVCNPSELLIIPRFITLGNDSTICSGGTLILGSAPITGYTYGWTPPTGLSSVSVANPVLTTLNLTTNPVSTNYILTTNRIGCSTKDTIRITVNPIPTSNAGRDTTVCSTSSLGSLGTANNPGYNYSWLPITGLSNPTVSAPSVALSIPGIITYTVTTSALGCSSKDSATVKVNPLPTAILTGTSAVCVGTAPQIVTFTGANGTAPYTFTYKLNGVLQPTILSTGNSYTFTIPTAVADTLTYVLINVHDASITACSQVQTDTATIMINPLPTATISGTTAVCEDTTMPMVLFIGANGTAPYTFTYNINNGNNQTISTIGSDSIALAVPTNTTGMYTYTLVSVHDSSTTACSQLQAGTATITVNPLPNATITGTTAVCVSAPAPNITFTGANGTAPYTFTYAINNVTQPIVSSTGNSITISVPTSVAGVFTYSLVSVHDASSTACLQTQAGSAIVTINDLPTATIASSSLAVCKNDAAPSLTFTGGNGTAPYTFTYTINGGANQTIISAGNSVTLAAPTGTLGTFTYALISVKDASSTTCSQTQTGSITITVNPLPIADFSSRDVCLHQIMNFYDSSKVAGGAVTGWVRNFGDNTPEDTTQNTGHIYANPGTYTVSLIAITNNGCKDTIIKNMVVHPLPVPTFYAANVCKGDSVHFNNTSNILATDTVHISLWSFGDNSFQSTNQNPSHFYTVPNSYQVKLICVSNFGCSDSIIKPVVLNPKPNVAFTGHDTIGCELLCVSFVDASTILTGGIAQWGWNFGDGSPLSTVSNTEHCYTNDSIFAPIVFNVALTVTSDSGCVSSLTKNNYITVFPKPVAGFSVTPTVTTIMTPIISFTNTTTGANFWNWNFGDADTSSVFSPRPHTYADTGKYAITLIVSTLHNCVDTARQTIIIEPDFSFYIPNAFTPNDDGINDTFNGKGIGIKTYEMTIFDRWGNLIFFTDDINKPWDGKANHGADIAQRDVYVWKVKLTDVFDNVHRYIGSVTLVR
jgi:gliding motility-associated-like protein